jgi:hypothetical protein
MMKYKKQREICARAVYSDEYPNLQWGKNVVSALFVLLSIVADT